MIPLYCLSMRSPERSEKIRRPEGCRVALRVYNEGARHTVILSGGLGTGGDGDALWRHLIDDLGADHRVVTWDYRGHGGSDEADGPGAYTAPALASDLAAVQDHVGAERAGHVGFGVGAVVALEHHRWAKERVAALVLIQGGLSLSEGRLPWADALRRRLMAEATSRGALQLASRGGRTPLAPMVYGAALRLGFVGRTCSASDFGALVASSSGHSARARREIARELARHRTDEVLSEVRVPTLVFGATRDAQVPESLMRQVHESLHNSEYVPLPGATHSCLLDQGPVIAARIRRFFEERRQQRPW